MNAENRMNMTTMKASKHEFNLCPMCWMPLKVNGDKAEDALWQLVQLVFKGKPAFSIEADGYKHERAVLVFGVSPLHPDAKSNCEECHFIHVSVFAESHRFHNPWLREIISEEPIKMDEKADLMSLLSRANNKDLTTMLNTFVSSINTTDGLWTGVLDFLPLEVELSMKQFGSSLVLNLIIKTFPGCRDCNQKMTVSKFIWPLFKCLMPSEDAQIGQVGRKRKPARRNVNRKMLKPIIKGRLPNEKMLFYILLGGMLDKKDVIKETENNYVFSVVDNSRRLSWRFRFVIMWSLIQILLSAWEGTTISNVFRHHISYVYSGIQDFYLSFLFFSLHCANGSSVVRGAETPLDFDAFHFFYSTHLPFFLINERRNPGKHISLSEYILKGIKFTQPEETDKAGVRGQFDLLKKAVLKFWNDDFKPLSDFIHGKGSTRVDSVHAKYFSSPESAMELRKRGSDDAKPLDVETFSHYFTKDPGYWFHFKYITMIKIERDCKLYYEQYKDINLVQNVWAQWYGCLCTCVKRLGLRRAGILAHGAANLMSVLHALYPGARWRMIAE